MSKSVDDQICRHLEHSTNNRLNILRKQMETYAAYYVFLVPVDYCVFCKSFFQIYRRWKIISSTTFRQFLKWLFTQQFSNKYIFPKYTCILPSYQMVARILVRTNIYPTNSKFSIIFNFNLNYLISFKYQIKQRYNLLFLSHDNINNGWYL